MAIPDYQSIMLPLLRFAEVRKTEISTSMAVDALASQFSLTDADLKEMLPSGLQGTFTNRVGWAATYMKKALLLESTRRGYYRITQRGKDLLNEKPATINRKLLERYSEFDQFQQLKGTRTGGTHLPQPAPGTATPLEALEGAYENLRDELQKELLTTLKA
ncbi:MAG: winged helix-turn-helix domain-containing protein, partial [Anaerolineae bacterium]